MLPMKLDIHTHTIASGHYTADTITDMLKQAKNCGLTLLGISEHGPSLPGSCAESYFRNISFAPAHRMGIRILYGTEANILDRKGTLDLPNDILSRLDYCIAGMHLPCLTPGSIRENTDAYIAALHNPYVKILAHTDDVKYPIDDSRLMEAVMSHHALLEINNSSLSPQGYRGNTLENNRRILELCLKYHYPVLLSSDSHGHQNIGDFTYALRLLREMHFPEHLILNTSVSKLMKFLEK